MNLVGKRVYVYRNLRHGHKPPKLYSIRYKGIVVARKEKVLLANVKFVVHERGRQRVLKTGQKNVHAYAVGTLVGKRGCMGIDADGKDFGIRLSYDPYKAPYFESQSGTPVKTAWAALLNQNGISACYTD